jgi:hypothetical protein
MLALTSARWTFSSTSRTPPLLPTAHHPPTSADRPMCFDFLLVYPIEAWPTGFGRTFLTAIGF